MRERLRVAIHALHLRQNCTRLRQQRVLDAQIVLAADVDISAPGEQVEYGGDGAGNAVFHRQHRVIHFAIAQFIQHIDEGLARLEMEIGDI